MGSVLVIGGFGYLGSIVVDQLCRSDLERVDILDNDIFDCAEKILINPFKVNNIYKKIEDLDITIYDYFVWCATPDIPLFYNSDIFLEYRNNILNTFKKIIINSNGRKIINCSHWMIDIELYNNDENLKMLEFFNILEQFVKKYNVINIRIPVLYGPSLRMRWDTEINEMLFSFFIQNKIFIENWLDTIPVMSVYECAINIVNCILKNKYTKLDYILITKIEIANLIKNCIGNENTIVHPIDLSPIIKRITQILNCPEINNSFIKFIKDFRFNIESMKKQLEDGMFEDFENDKYNNSEIFSKILFGLNYLERFK